VNQLQDKIRIMTQDHEKKVTNMEQDHENGRTGMNKLFENQKDTLIKDKRDLEAKMRSDFEQMQEKLNA
jgi:hypothetical protein